MKKTTKMARNKMFRIEMAAMALIFGMVFIGCDNPSGGDGDDGGGWTLTITNLPNDANGKRTRIVLRSIANVDSDFPSTEYTSNITGNQVSGVLYTGYDKGLFNTAGDYFLRLGGDINKITSSKINISGSKNIDYTSYTWVDSH
jgi:hypothetical protein